MALLVGIAVAVAFVGVGGYLALFGTGQSGTRLFLPTALLVGLHGALAAFLLRRGSKRTHGFDRAILVLLALNLLASIVAQWASAGWYFGEAVFEQSVAFGVFFALALPAQSLHLRGEHNWLVRANWAACAVTFALTTAYIWLPWHNYHWLVHTIIRKQGFGIAVVCTLALTASTIVCLHKPRRAKAVLPIIALALIGCASATAIVRLLNMLPGDSAGLDNLTAFLVLLSGAVVVAQVIQVKWQTSPAQSDEMKRALTLSTMCPGCQREIDLPPGESECPNCNTSFVLRVTPKHCIKCRYPLADLRQPTCPECGTAY